MVGRTISHYEILEKLGEGGMGVVYRATDLSLNRGVAIKFLSSDVADELRRRFQQEAQTASSLNHPHILTVFEAGTVDGQQYLVTELVDGGTLKDWARQEKHNWRQIVELLVGIADGLAAAHQAGILHRDIKPENILVAKNGYAKLADFGLAKQENITHADVTRTMTENRTRPGVVLGTLAYMSPEQASGRPLDARSDIFSFGVVLYEMLARRRPFTGATDLELLQTIIHGTPEPLGEIVPIALRIAVEKSIEKDPTERYQTIRDLVVDLRRLTKYKVAEVAPAAVAKTPWRWLPWALVAGLAAGVVLWEARHSAAPLENPLASAHFTRFTNFEGDKDDAAISRDGKFVAFRADRDGPFDVWLSQIGSGRFVNLTQGKDAGLRTPTRSMGFSADGSEIWLSGIVAMSGAGGGTVAKALRRLRLMPLMGGTPRVFLREGVVAVAWSPDGSHLVYHTGDPGDPMFVADSTGANAHQVLAGQSGVHHHFPTWSLDGRWIYFVGGVTDTYEMDLWRIEANGGTPERLTQHNNDVRYPTPIDPRTLLYASPSDDGSGPWLWALDLEHKITRRVSFGLEKYTSIDASADGRRLVASVSNPTASLWSVPILDRVAEERDVKAVPLPTVRAWLPSYGGGSLFYLSSRGTGDGLWRYQAGQSFEIWKGSNGPLLEPAGVSPDGQRATIVLRGSGKRRLHVVSADGAELQSLAEAIDVRGTACWSPDGKWIVTGGNDVKGAGLFKIPVAGGAPVRLVASPALNPVWSADGDVIVYAGAPVALYSPLHAVRPDGASFDLPAIQTRGAARFLRHGKILVYMQGSLASQDFWLLDLATKKTRTLTHLSNTATMRTFDITPDDRQIVFDRLRENSDVVLIDLPK